MPIPVREFAKFRFAEPGTGPDWLVGLVRQDTLRGCSPTLEQSEYPFLGSDFFVRPPFIFHVVPSSSSPRRWTACPILQDGTSTKLLWLLLSPLFNSFCSRIFFLCRQLTLCKDDPTAFMTVLEWADPWNITFLAFKDSTGNPLCPYSSL